MHVKNKTFVKKKQVCRILYYFLELLTLCIGHQSLSEASFYCKFHFLLVVLQLSCFRHSGFVEESLMLIFQLLPERHLHMKSFIAERVKSILVNLRYLRFKLLKYKENKKICNTFDHNFKNISLYIMRKVSLEIYYFVLYDGALTVKISKMALNSFCDETIHIHVVIMHKQHNDNIAF